MADDIGKQIAGAYKGEKEPPAELVAAVIIKTIFGNGLDRDHKYMAQMALVGALTTWREQILKGAGDIAEWQRIAKDAKAEMEELKTRVFFLERG